MLSLPVYGYKHETFEFSMIVLFHVYWEYVIISRLSPIYTYYVYTRIASICSRYKNRINRLVSTYRLRSARADQVCKVQVNADGDKWRRTPINEQTHGASTSSLSQVMNETKRKLKCIACHNPCALISLKRRSLRNIEHSKRLKFIDPLNVRVKCVVVVECQNNVT